MDFLYALESVRVPVLNELMLPEMPARAVRYCLIVVVAGIVWPLTFR